MDIDQIIKELKTQLLNVLGKKYNEFKPEIQKDINTFLKKSQEKLERWTILLADKAITPEEFEWLLKSQKDLTVLQALQTAGVSKIRLNNIKNSIIKTAFDVITKAVLI
jgi:hypothetical protein